MLLLALQNRPRAANSTCLLAPLLPDLEADDTAYTTLEKGKPGYAIRSQPLVALCCRDEMLYNTLSLFCQPFSKRSQVSLFSENHRWIRPASLKQRTVSFLRSVPKRDGGSRRRCPSATQHVTPPAAVPIRDNADDGREGKDEQPLLPSSHRRHPVCKQWSSTESTK